MRTGERQSEHHIVEAAHRCHVNEYQLVLFVN